MDRLETEAKDAGRAVTRSKRPGGRRSGARRHKFLGEKEAPTALAAALLGADPETIKTERRLAGLSQTDAARHVGLAHGSRWAEFESGARPIDGARWELFLIKVGRHPYCLLSAREAPLGTS